MTLAEILGIGATVIGATWVLRSKLSDIEKAVHGHVERDDERHKSLDGRVVSLEEWRNRGRR